MTFAVRNARHPASVSGAAGRHVVFTITQDLASRTRHGDASSWGDASCVDNARECQRQTFDTYRRTFSFIHSFIHSLNTPHGQQTHHTLQYSHRHRLIRNDRGARFSLPFPFTPFPRPLSPPLPSLSCFPVHCPFLFFPSPSLFSILTP